MSRRIYCPQLLFATRSVILPLLVAIPLSPLAMDPPEHSPSNYPVPEVTPQQNWSKRWLNTGQGEVLEYAVDENRLQIPQELVRDAAMDRPELVIVMGWPNMAAWTRKPESASDVAEINANRFRVLFAPREIRRRSGFKSKVENIHRMVEKGQLGPPESRPEAPSLTCYPWIKVGTCRYFVSENKGLLDANDNPIVIGCSPPSTETSYRYRKCRVNFQIAPGVVADYRFYDKHITDWERIHNIVRGFLVPKKHDVN